MIYNGCQAIANVGGKLNRGKFQCLIVKYSFSQSALMEDAHLNHEVITVMIWVS